MAELPLAAASRRLRWRNASQRDIKSLLGRQTRNHAPDLTVLTEDGDRAARRGRIRSILDRSHGVLFDAQSLESWRGPIVYVALKDAQPVYVGCSRQGLRRVFSQHHKGQAFIGADLMVWCMPSLEDMYRLERLLIEGLKPALNHRQHGDAQRVAELMGLSVNRARQWVADRRQA